MPTEVQQPDTEPIALIDMDGTVADFDKAMERHLGWLAGPDDPPRVSGPRRDTPQWMKARQNLIRIVPGFWRDIPKLEAGFEVLGLLRELKFSLNILTKGPDKSINAWSEKVEWCQEHVPDAAITITQDKGLVYGRVLFDDWPPYVRRWLEWRPRGLIVMMDWPWNRDFAHPNVFRYYPYEVGSGEWKQQYEWLRDKLVEARDR